MLTVPFILLFMLLAPDCCAFLTRCDGRVVFDAGPAEAQEKGKKRKNDTYRFQIKQGTVKKDVRTFLFSHCKLVDGLVIDDRYAFYRLVHGFLDGECVVSKNDLKKGASFFAEPVSE